MSIMEQIASAIAARRFRFTNEVELQAMLAAAFAEDGLVLERERRLSPGDRPDFFHPAEGIVVEVKIGGSTSALLRQLFRYAALDVVRGIVLVSSVALHTTIPEVISDKPVRIVRVGGFL